METPPYAFVQVQGDGDDDGGPGELVASATLIGRRYMGAERAEEFGRRNGVPGELLVKLRPTKVVTDHGHHGLSRGRLTRRDRRGPARRPGRCMVGS